MNITHEALRGIGFRIIFPEIDGSPRMLLSLDRREELFLELCEPHSPLTGGWFCWLRSDCSHRRARFVHIRHLQTMEEVELLIVALSGRPVEREEFDAEKFAESLANARQEGALHWAKYCSEGFRRDFIARHS